MTSLILKIAASAVCFALCNSLNFYKFEKITKNNYLTQVKKLSTHHIFESRFITH